MNQAQPWRNHTIRKGQKPIRIKTPQSSFVYLGEHKVINKKGILETRIRAIPKSYTYGKNYISSTKR